MRAVTVDCFGRKQSREVLNLIMEKFRFGITHLNVYLKETVVLRLRTSETLSELLPS